MKTLIIQGYCLKECVDWNLSHYSDKFDEIIISTYRTEYTESISGAKVIFNDIDVSDHYNFQNLYLHSGTVLSAATEAKPGYCLKIRGDEYYTGLDALPMNPAKVLCNNVFFSPLTKFHISDHMIGMDRDAMVLAFGRIQEKCRKHEYAMYLHDSKFFGGAEEVIFREFMFVMGYQETMSWNDLISTHIDLVYVYDLEPMRIAYNSEQAEFRTAYAYYTHPAVADSHWRGVMRKGGLVPVTGRYDDIRGMVMLGISQPKPIPVVYSPRKQTQFDLLG